MNNLPALRTHSAVLTASPIGSDIPKVPLTRVAALVPKDPLSAYQELNSLLAASLGAPPPRWKETNWVDEVFAVFSEAFDLVREDIERLSKMDLPKEECYTSSGKPRFRLRQLEALEIAAKRRGKSAQVMKMRLCWFNNASRLSDQIGTWAKGGTMSASCITALFPFGTTRPLTESAVTVVVAELKVCLQIAGRILPRHVKFAIQEAQNKLGTI